MPVSNEAFAAYLEKLVDSLRFMEEVHFEAGLTDAEVAQIEQTYGIRFPPDLRALLQYALPISEGWVNWRDSSLEAAIRERLDWPAEGICFDIEHNALWLTEWGEKPNNLQKAFAIARQHVAQAPMLIPICSHRYLPSEPLLAGNPVLSVYQTDIIYYGYDLASYFVQEFGTLVPKPEWAADEPGAVRFWDTFL